MEDSCRFVENARVAPVDGALFLHPSQRLRIRLRNRGVESDKLLLGLGGEIGKRVIAHDSGVVLCRNFLLFTLADLFENVTEHPERLIGFAVERIAIAHLHQSGGRRAVGRHSPLDVVVVADSEVAFRQNLLDFPETLFGLGSKRALGILLQESLEFVLRPLGLRTVSVRFGHLAVISHSHLHLGVRGLWIERKEDDEIFVAGDGLGEIGATAFLVVGVCDGELRFGQVIAVGVGINQGLKGKPAYLLTAVLNIVQSPLVQNLVRLD